MQVQGAAVSMEENNFIIILVGMDLVDAPGEADMTIDALSGKFSDTPVVLMAQREDTSPVYYGDKALVRLLRDVPIDQLPWKQYSV